MDPAIAHSPEHRARRLLRPALSGVAGGAFACLCVVARSAVDWAGAQFPATGDDDFGVRTAWLVLAIYPAFVVGGAWLGSRDTAKDWKVVLAGFAGALAASAAWFAALHAAQPWLWQLPAGRTANAAAVGSMLVWLAVALGGAYLAGCAARTVLGSTPDR